MSDSMTNMEIEDVLSSIRRLVSDDNRPTTRPADHPTPGLAARVPDKLVLTPALRVVPEPSAAPALSPADLVAQEVVTELDARSHQAAAAALEAALSDHADIWEPDGSEVAQSTTEAWTLEWTAETPDAPAQPEFASTRKVRIDPPDPEPVEAPLDWTDTFEDDGDQDQGPAPFRHQSLADEDEMPIVDEESLRDLIRDVLREELQGALGERITRNVRKLVRAEVNRVLAAREFD